MTTATTITEAPCGDGVGTENQVRIRFLPFWSHNILHNILSTNWPRQSASRHSSQPMVANEQIRVEIEVKILSEEQREFDICT